MTPLVELASQYEKAIASVDATNQRLAYPANRPALLANHAVGQPWAHRHIFSDSIILVALDETDDSCLKLMLYARHLVQALLGSRLAVRGAVSAGELHYNPAGNAVLGKALTEAYEIEQDQDWVGVAISDTVWEAYPELARAVANPEGALNYYFLDYPVPLKSGHRRMRILNWRFNLVVDIGTGRLLANTGLDAAPSKHANTIAYLKHLRSIGALYFGPDCVPPAECNTVWIGAKAPPFEHGDEL
jgi:hypothetical protein